MVKQASLLEDLREIVGDEHAGEPHPGRYCELDGKRPGAVVRPGSYEEVAEVLRYANGRGLYVIPQGGQCLFIKGNVPRGYDIALILTRLDQVVNHEPADLTVTCQAGLTAGGLNAQLASYGQMVPLFGPDPDNTTVGGLLAANVSGWALRYGKPRDFTIGMRVVTADGRITRAGGQVVKNVAGYDLCKLHIGALGTLGVIVEATFKVFPLPQAGQSRSLEFDTISDTCDFVTEVEHRRLALSHTEVRNVFEQADGRWRTTKYFLNIALAGSPAAVTRSAEEIDQMVASGAARDYEQRATPIDETPNLLDGRGPIAVEINVPQSKVPELVEGIVDEVNGAVLGPIDPLLGEVFAIWVGAKAEEEERLINRLSAVVKHLGGTMVVTLCSPELKSRIDVFGDPPPSFPLMRAIKHQFDPNGILSPGRFVGRL